MLNMAFTSECPQLQDCRISEFDDKPHAGSAEVELCVAQVEPQQIEILERVKVPHVAAQSGPSAEENVDAAADVPSKAVVVAREDARGRE
jgi:hypothetical protein